MTDLTLTPIEQQRYARQMHLPEIGAVGQQRLKASKVLYIGVGGLGSPALLYLAAAGVGTIGLVDDDKIDLSNLQRQVLFNTNELGELKAKAAKAHLLALNPTINIIDHPHRINPENALDLINAYDVICDGTDNFKTKYLINDVCFSLKKPLVYASILGFEGQCSVFNIDDSPCYRCLYPEPPQQFVANCAQAGVIGPLAGILGSIQACEVLKILLQTGDCLSHRLLTIDTLTMCFKEYRIHKNKHCILCQQQEPWLNLSSTTFNEENAITFAQLKHWQDLYKNLQLIDVREQHEHQNQNIAGKNIPLAQLPSELERLDKNQLTIVYCQRGPRSLQALHLLKKAGFNQCYYLQGGMSELGSVSEIIAGYKIS